MAKIKVEMPEIPWCNVKNPTTQKEKAVVNFSFATYSFTLNYVPREDPRNTPFTLALRTTLYVGGHTLLEKGWQMSCVSWRKSLEMNSFLISVGMITTQGNRDGLTALNPWKQDEHTYMKWAHSQSANETGATTAAWILGDG